MTANLGMPPPSAVERVLARDRHLIALALALLIVIAWTYLVVLSRRMGAQVTDMASMPGMAGMPGMSAMPAATDTAWRSFALAALMWWTMMIGMMLPSAAPMILLFGRLQRRQLAAESPRLRVGLFTGAYLATWGAFSLAAAAAQELMIRLGVLAAMDLTVSSKVGAVVVALAGVYQLTPLKNVCLRRCRSPAEFLANHWQRGNAGAVRMGIVHGAYCVGCCWLLMALLFVAGVMNLVWVAAIAVLVLLEKLVPHGELLARVSGVALLLLAAYVAVGA